MMRPLNIVDIKLKKPKSNQSLDPSATCDPSKKDPRERFRFLVQFSKNGKSSDQAPQRWISDLNELGDQKDHLLQSLRWAIISNMSKPCARDWMEGKLRILDAYLAGTSAEEHSPEEPEEKLEDENELKLEDQNPPETQIDFPETKVESDRQSYQPIPDAQATIPAEPTPVEPKEENLNGPPPGTLIEDAPEGGTPPKRKITKRSKRKTVARPQPSGKGTTAPRLPNPPCPVPAEVAPAPSAPSAVPESMFEHVIFFLFPELVSQTKRNLGHRATIRAHEAVAEIERIQEAIESELVNLTLS